MSEMRFSYDSTARGDEIADYVRQWYEKNREGWQERLFKRWEVAADEFMIRLVNEVIRVTGEAERQYQEMKNKEMKVGFDLGSDKGEITVIQYSVSHRDEHGDIRTWNFDTFEEAADCYREMYSKEEAKKNEVVG